MSNYNPTDPNWPNQPPPPPRQGMSTGMKVLIALLIIGGILIVLCCGGAIFIGYWFQGKGSSDPTVVQQIADDIAEIDLPQEFRPAMSLDLRTPLQIVWAAFRSEDGRSSVVLAKLGALYAEQSDEQRFATLQQYLEASQFRIVDPAPGTQTSRQQQLQVRGQPATFTITTGKDPVDGGQRIKAAGVIPNGQERTIVIVSVDADDHSEEQVVKMLESIK